MNLGFLFDEFVLKLIFLINCFQVFVLCLSQQFRSMLLVLLLVQSVFIAFSED